MIEMKTVVLKKISQYMIIQDFSFFYNPCNVFNTKLSCEETELTVNDYLIQHIEKKMKKKLKTVFSFQNTETNTI